MFSSIMKATVLSAFCGLLYLVIWTDAAESGTIYKVESLTCDINYGRVIAKTQAKSAIHCSSKCESWRCCRSGVFDVSTATCYLNSMTKNSSNIVQGKCGKKLKYIEKQACESTEECIKKNSPLCAGLDADSCVSCRKGKCSCKSKDHQYNNIDNTCRTDCKNYDDNFEYISSFKKDWSDKAKRSDVSLEECEEACLCETSFTCIWFSYNAKPALCTYTDGISNGMVGTQDLADTYRRLCADP